MRVADKIQVQRTRRGIPCEGGCLSGTLYRLATFFIRDKAKGRISEAINERQAADFCMAVAQATFREATSHLKAYAAKRGHRLKNPTSAGIVVTSKHNHPAQSPRQATSIGGRRRTWPATYCWISPATADDHFL
jgi:hypothetical protein